MSSTTELDPIIKHALKLLHSPSPDSAEKIRQSLDDIIKQRHGTSKMLINTINKKYIAEECISPGTVKRQKSSDSRSSASGKNSSPLPQEVSVPETVAIPIEISDAEIKALDVSEEENLKDFGDLACVICGAMVFTAGNRLVECADCHSLYHQECHRPPISDDDANEQEYSWCCTSCKNKVMTSTVASVPSPSKSSSSQSSTSSTSSSPYYKNYENAPAVKNKSGSSKSSNSSSSSKAVVGGSSTSSPTLSSTGAAVPTKTSSSSLPVSTPHINIISVDKRLQIMKKKAAKQHESKRKK